jgi:hypothetical protein
MHGLPPPDDVWVDQRVVPLDSGIEGTGLFCTHDIGGGEVVLWLGGRLVDSSTLSDLIAATVRDPTAVYIDTVTVYEEAHLVLPPATPIHFVNHSCDPNLWHVDAYKIAARRPIAAGEELTVDYGTNSGAEGFLMECRCGSPRCRGTITSDDWRIRELQLEYQDHWTPALRERIDGLASSD